MRFNLPDEVILRSRQLMRDTYGAPAFCFLNGIDKPMSTLRNNEPKQNRKQTTAWTREVSDRQAGDPENSTPSETEEHARNVAAIFFAARFLGNERSIREARETYRRAISSNYRGSCIIETGQTNYDHLSAREHPAQLAEPLLPARKAPGNSTAHECGMRRVSLANSLRRFR